jgi:hypothetical protein
MSNGYQDQSDVADAGGAGNPKRPYIGVFFECCGVYARIYRRPDEKMYIGRCPRCLRQVQARVGPEGVSARIFRAK